MRIISCYHGTHCAETDKPIAGLLTDLCGSGIKGGTIVGATDEYGYAAVESGNR